LQFCSESDDECDADCGSMNVVVTRTDNFSGMVIENCATVTPSTRIAVDTLTVVSPMLMPAVLTYLATCDLVPMIKASVFRLHRMHEIQIIVTDVRRVRLSVCLSRGKLGFTEQKWLNRSRCCLG